MSVSCRLLLGCFLLLFSATAFASTQRIVALAPSAAELIQALGCGERIVGRSGDSGAELAPIPDVGSYDRPSMEAILACRPDLCVAVADGTPLSLVARLHGSGVDTVVLDVHSFEILKAELARLGEVLDVRQKAESLIRSMEERLERSDARRREAEAGSARPTVLFLLQEKPFMAAAQGTFISHLLRNAGGMCAVAAQGDVHYPVLGREEVARIAPDIVLVADMSSDGGELPKRLDWTAFPEFAGSRVYAVDADIFTRPSLRALDALDQLIELLHETPR